MACKSLFVLAAFALGVNTSPHPVLASRDTSICSRIDPQGDVICNREGYVTDDSQKWPSPSMEISLEACAESCASSAGCGFFNWRDGGYCQLFAKSISDAGFYEASSSSFWYEMGCWACQSAALRLDFEDGDVSSWTLDTSAEYSHFLDIQTPYTTNGATTHALRIMEATNDAFALAEYVPDIPLEAGRTYRLSFKAKSTAYGNTNWDLVTITIASSPDLYKHHPESGAGTDIGGGWRLFVDEFMLDAGWSGHATLRVSIDPSGLQSDWYFDEFTIIAV